MRLLRSHFRQKLDNTIAKVNLDRPFLKSYVYSSLYQLKPLSKKKDFYVAEPLKSRQCRLCGESIAARRGRSVRWWWYVRRYTAPSCETYHNQSHRKASCLHASRKLERQESTVKGQLYAKKLTYQRSSCKLKTSKPSAAGVTDLSRHTNFRTKQRPAKRKIPLAAFLRRRRM